jgi:hypothetical protein
MPASRNRAGEQPAEAAADDEHFDFIGQRFALDRLVDVRVLDVVGERAGDFDVLLVAVGAQTLLALRRVLGAQCVRIEISNGHFEASSRSTLRRILPDADFGTASRNVTLPNRLYVAT